MSRRCGVVVAHGRLAEGLLSALARVAGPQENLWAVSNDGLGGDALARAVEEILEERSGGREAFLFSDLGGGSCGQACRRLVDRGVVAAVIYGVNLPLLVEFAFLDPPPGADFVETLLEKGRGAVGVHQ